jgi:3-isopropylmalate/(R)-2-methylmalate dehydratase large subunit
MSEAVGKTLYDKLWDAHVVREDSDGTALIYIDRQLLHEVTSPQAFEGLRMANRKPWRIDANLATLDHNVPTTDYKTAEDILDPISRIQVQTLGMNTQEFGITVFGIGDVRQGIVHVVGPEEGATLPGMTLVCGDSHTATHGALAALAHGVGTSEVEHVLATQCLIQKKMKNMRVNIEGKLQKGVSPKDVILDLIAKIGTAGGTGYAVQFTGQVMRDMSVEGRMTICNMAIEAGARVGLTGVDNKTIEYVKNKPFAPKGKDWDEAVREWRKLRADNNAVFDKVVEMDGSLIDPQVSWGTTPEMVTSIKGKVPDPKDEPDTVKADGIQRALDYMGLKANMPMTEIPVEYIFIGSCTNARIEDFRAAAKILRGKKISEKIEQAIIVPGSGLVKRQAEKEGLDKIFIEAGFEWRNPGCSMCLAMNDDKLPEGKHCASTSNRNFEGRQGAGGRTHLVSPEMAAAAAVAGHFVDVREMLDG